MLAANDNARALHRPGGAFQFPPFTATVVARAALCRALFDHHANKDAPPSALPR